MHQQFDIHQEREQNKIWLETYFLDEKNMFGIAIDKLIDELKAGILKSQDKFNGWHKLLRLGLWHTTTVLKILK